MNYFRIGQKVRCIDDSGESDLILNEIYHVTAIRKATGGVKLFEAKVRVPCSGYFRKERFVPVENDDKWLEQILEEVLREPFMV